MLLIIGSILRYREKSILPSLMTDQGAQFTSTAFIGALTAHPSISISMDGRGRALDNIFVERFWRIKHGDVYLKGDATAAELQCGLKKYFIDYSVDRSHRSLGYGTPEKVYRAASGGGARIVDKYRKLNQADRRVKGKRGAVPFRCMNRSGYQLKLSHFLSTGWGTL